MRVGTLEKNAEWGAEVVLQDLANIMPKDAKNNAKDFLKTCDIIEKKATLLLRKIESYELSLKKTKTYQNKNSVALHIYYSQAKQSQSLKRIMVEAYAFISYLRSWLTGTTIEYLIAIENKKTTQVLHLTLEQLINTVSVGVSKDKGFKLTLSSLNVTQEMINDLDHFKNFEAELKQIEQNLLSILQQITIRANKKTGTKRQRVMNTLGITGDKLNRGFVTETAVQMYAALGRAAKTITDPVQLASFYCSTVGSLPGFRGGDIDEETTKKFLQNEGRDFQQKVELQVKRINGLFGASVIEINTLKYELFNIATKIHLAKQKGSEALQKELTDYFTSSKKASDVAKTIAKDLEIKLDKQLSETLKGVKNITIT